jgi:hypothetical protein
MSRRLERSIAVGLEPSPHNSASHAPRPEDQDGQLAQRSAPSNAEVRRSSPRRPTTDRQLPRDEVEEDSAAATGFPSTDTPSTWSALAARLKGGAAAQPPGDVPGLTANKMNSVNTSPST